MRHIFSQIGILLIVSGFIFLALIYGTRFSYLELKKLSQDASLIKQIRAIDQKEQVLHQQTLKIAQIDQTLKRIDRSKKPIYSHLDFVHYLEENTRRLGSNILTLPQENQIQEGEYIISEARFQIQGSLKAILNVIYELEQTDRIGNIQYLHLETQTIRKQNQRKQVLAAIIILKRIIPSKYENTNLP